MGGCFDQETYNQQGTGMIKLVEFYCDADDFCKVFILQWQKLLLDYVTQKRRRHGRLSTSEIMTIVIGFHMPYHCYFKNYYLATYHVCIKKNFQTCSVILAF